MAACFSTLNCLNCSMRHFFQLIFDMGHQCNLLLHDVERARQAGVDGINLTQCRVLDFLADRFIRVVISLESPSIT